MAKYVTIQSEISGNELSVSRRDRLVWDHVKLNAESIPVADFIQALTKAAEGLADSTVQLDLETIDDYYGGVNSASLSLYGKRELTPGEKSARNQAFRQLDENEQAQRDRTVAAKKAKFEALRDELTQMGVEV